MDDERERHRGPEDEGRNPVRLRAEGARPENDRLILGTARAIEMMHDIHAQAYAVDYLPINPEGGGGLGLLGAVLFLPPFWTNSCSSSSIKLPASTRGRSEQFTPVGPCPLPAT